MKTLTKRVIIGALALPLVMGSTAALAFGGGNGGGHHGDRMGGGKCDMMSGKRALKQLDLSEQQQTEFKDLMATHRSAMQDRQPNSELQQLKQQMNTLLLNADFNEDEVRSLATQMSTLQVDKKVEMAQKRHQMLNILTEEQKIEFQEAQQQMMVKCQAKK
ncbi:MAG: periplasmic heavy metal sensor [Aliivibrio sp.]|uniref:periplasmic heavy metal sensor n=1 Tax=Aliivibrio sp. TaxID=1872443 RepID=UPI001A400875|nr:periplasmic heavy metal sensor [Aliivibrio sp.]